MHDNVDSNCLVHEPSYQELENSIGSPRHAGCRPGTRGASGASPRLCPPDRNAHAQSASFRAPELSDCLCPGWCTQRVGTGRVFWPRDGRGYRAHVQDAPVEGSRAWAPAAVARCCCCHADKGRLKRPRRESGRVCGYFGRSFGPVALRSNFPAIISGLSCGMCNQKQRHVDLCEGWLVDGSTTQKSKKKQSCKGFAAQRSTCASLGKGHCIVRGENAAVVVIWTD